MRSEAFSAIITTGEAVLPEGCVGMIEASTMRRPGEAVDAQVCVDHGGRICAHPAGADGMEDGRGDVADGAKQIGVRGHGRAGQELLRARSGGAPAAPARRRAWRTEVRATARSRSELR